MMGAEGFVFDIKRFSVHDGPGIRTTVFVKGCTLRCGWCQNPEGQEFQQVLWHFPNKCIGCLACVKACPKNALEKFVDEGSGKIHIDIDRKKCDLCGICTEACPTEAITFDSKKMSADEVVEVLLRDRVFYRESGGGITISGGDPLGRYDFVRSILKECKEADLHTALETCLQGPQEHLRALMPHVDLFLTDIKLLDPEKHKEYTGFENKQILDNFRFLCSGNVPIIVRIPLIPGITAKENNLRAIAGFVRETSHDVPIELINYNHLARDKYRIMSRPYAVSQDAVPYSEDQLRVFRDAVESEGVALYKEE